MTLEDLDTYLSSDESPENCMMLSDLDGFMHGIACSPVLISAEEWVSVALGGDPNDVPAWVLKMITMLYVDIVEGLCSDPPEVEPIFWEAKEGHVIAMDWCEGFMDAVALRPKEWLRLTESGTHGFLMTPILCHLIDENGNSVLGIPQEKLDESLALAAQDIPSAIVGIHQFWGQNTKTE
ncbi:YecA family protein [Nioella aestuarii]|uniref:YecA/YgfB family protein n=1 Tax=Nioella aestuarii TaxID=1662864 RepID=UPI003D7F51A8